MKGVRVAILMLLISFASCHPKDKTPKPDVLIDVAQMIDLMTDLQIIEADLNYRRSNAENIGALTESYYAQVFEHYGITDSIFSQNMAYYTHYPETLERIMDSVTLRLTEQQDQLKRGKGAQTGKN